MNRFFLGILLPLTLLLPFGCSRDTEPLPRARDINVLVAASPAEESFIRAQIEDFEKFNWNAKIRLHIRPAGFALAGELARMESKGQPIDLIVFDAGELAELSAGGRLMNMGKDSRVKPIVDSIHPALLDRLSGKNGVMALPLFWSTTVLAYDKRIFDRIGMSYPSEYWGWPDVLEAAQAATMDTDRDGRKDQFGLELRGSADEIVMMFWQFEGVFNGQAEAKTLAQIMSPENRVILEQTIDFYADMAGEMNVAVVAQPPKAPQYFRGGESGNDLRAMAGSHRFGRRSGPGILQIAPRHGAGQGDIGLRRGSWESREARTANSEALALMKFLLRADAQRALAAGGVGLPVLSELSESAIQRLGGSWDMNSFYGQLPHAQIAPAPVVMAGIQKMLDERLSSGVRIVPDSDERPSFRSRLKLRLDSEKK
ncbi:extracellular solute-binding protein [Geitlerinema calcuttense]|uniref:Extracellular solute-binding protein n=1 Tax=Geitlerinema calcuttense NRMC-F 0142 TaxID=2922238 RepID=A0ABT7M0Y9_9CYAN|nr:extracellular solute-binding protein [Geitlerinema calcuttense]MDL5057923.1 extracellular solute-binding protein [Geitlerinema calcuttense NRMC-F 0142]